MNIQNTLLIFLLFCVTLLYRCSCSFDIINVWFWKCSNTDATCVLYQSHIETWDHFFFSFQCFQETWMKLTKNLLRTWFPTDWKNILDLLANNGGNDNDMFLLRYVFQIFIQTIWRERNWRKHGLEPYYIHGWKWKVNHAM